ncbi:MAG TPA: LacI family DNA-binding transcriptional regulator [Thermomicrobiales bacterium]|nr:LacI family DNA-binding transcriptional regulator [Thermomicrobiales bacterium]
MTDARLKKRPTQDDVARRAGVSQSVVSLVLNNRSLAAISPETRRRVQAVIDELGYVPDGAARSLRTRKTQIVASLIPDIANPFYPAFERGMQDVADAHGYVLSAFNTDGLRDKELRCIRSVLRARIDGVIATPFQLTSADFSPLIECGVPVVVFGELTDEPPAPAYDCLYVDDFAAAGELLDYLIDRDYRPLAMIASSGDVLRREGRGRAYRRALAEATPPQAPILADGKDPTEAGGYAAMRALLRRSPRPRAVFADNDMMAIGAMLAIREAGLRVPDDVAIAGFDDIVVARLLNPPLTTVAQFPERLGRRAAEMLFERLDGGVEGPGRRVEMPYELMIRASA